MENKTFPFTRELSDGTREEKGYYCFCYDCDDGDNDINNTSKFVRLGCTCITHYHCLIQYVRYKLGDRLSMSLNGISCPSGSDCKSFKTIDDVGGDDTKIYYITTVDLDNIVDYGTNHPDLKKYLDENNCEKFTHEEVNDLRKWIEEQKNEVNKKFNDNDFDLFIISTTKACSNCGFRVTHSHGHQCHHISPSIPPKRGGCPNCHVNYCYKCLSSEVENKRDRGKDSSCLCGSWSTFCCPITSSSDIKEYIAINEGGIPFDNRCGCVICSDCQYLTPCSYCQGDCCVCKGYVNPSPNDTNGEDKKWKAEGVLLLPIAEGLLPLLVRSIQQGGDVCIRALATCEDLSALDESRVCMASKELGLLQTLMGVLRKELQYGGDICIRVLAICCFLSISDQNRFYMASEELGLLPLLRDVVAVSHGSVLINALGTFQNLTISDESRVYISSKQLGLLPLLVDVIKQDKGVARTSALVICQNLSFTKEILVYMASQNLGLIPLLIELLENDVGLARIDSLGIFYNLCFANENRVFFLASSELNLLPLVIRVIEQDQGEARIAAVALCWAFVCFENIDTMIASGIHEVILNLLVSAGDSTYEEDSCEEMSVNFFLSFARYSTAARATRDLSDSVLSLFTSMLSLNSVTKLKASFIISYLIGKDEALPSGEALLQRSPDILPSLISVFENTMKSEGGEGYEIGVFEIPTIVSAVLALSVSDGNKAVLVASLPLLHLIIGVLEMYRDDAAGIENCLGGGNDVESAEAAIEALLQLSFYFDNDEDLRCNYLTPDLKVAELMTSLLNLPSSRKFVLGSSAKQSASSLLKRLTGEWNTYSST